MRAHVHFLQAMHDTSMAATKRIIEDLRSRCRIVDECVLKERSMGQNDGYANAQQSDVLLRDNPAWFVVRCILIGWNRQLRLIYLICIS